ncbi:hypothetical protein KCG44_08420 [Pacificimonas sp. WHA3]|uniref:Tat pathway signal protein n=1 Tax=Pacificimonas pallii TaxID=2827236 RepID=A0ABS6SEK9_9SPHN|nr:hypothetical protein [Pacificimonas pallii]MBV7256810.1 hypothetical protein [Pacificimonas pallii]
MANETETPEGTSIDAEENARVASRRRVLKLGAIAVPAVATLSPSMAMANNGGGAAVSMMACQVRIPSRIDADGDVVPDNAHVFRQGGHWVYKKDPNSKQKTRVFRVGSNFSYSGQQIKDATAGGVINPPAGVGRHKFEAHVRYMQHVRSGNVPGAGLSCLVSLTNSLNVANI